MRCAHPDEFVPQWPSDNNSVSHAHQKGLCGMPSWKGPSCGLFAAGGRRHATIGLTMTLLLFLSCLLAAGAAGYALLVRLGLDDFDAWAAGRTLGLVLVAFPAWWAGVFGLHGWRTLGIVLLVGLGVAGAIELWRRRAAWRAVAGAEAVLVVAAVAVLLVRLDHPQIVGQEKPMDVGILATLLRSDGFPPLDMWLAGERLPYYYWGALLWTTPLAASGLRLELAYNLIVALVAGSAAVALWALGRRLAGGGRWAGLTAAFFGVLAGTPDGWRQLLGGTGIRSLDIWRSSRQHQDVITEFPLFTAWLGDLHPHYLSLPIAATALLLAWQLGRRRPALALTAAVTVLFGVAWAANPWCMPPTLAGVALLVLCADGRWHWPAGEGRWRWLAVATIAIGGWLAAAPFHLAFHPPFEGLKPVFAWTSPGTLLLYGGCLLVPAFAAAVILLRDRLAPLGGAGSALLLGAGALLMVVAAGSGRPTLVLLTGALIVLVWIVLAPGELPERPALALAALGLFLFAVPEMFYVIDSYGERLHRMNTVFKAWIQAWVLLAVALPVLLRIAAPRRTVRLVATALLVAAALPHLLWMAGNQLAGRPLGLDGMAWMAEGDRAVVRFLREQPRQAAVIEAVGGAYTEYARLSANSGVPALIGWENHELVWRGHGVVEETSRRAALVRELYSCGDPSRVREIAAGEGIPLVAIGALELADFGEPSLSAVRLAGELALDEAGGQVVRIEGAGPVATEVDDG
jgi:YYY domain-containing protein